MAKLWLLSLAFGIGIAPFLFAVPLQKAKGTTDSRKWLAEHMDEMITEMDLAKAYGAPYDLVEQTLNKRRKMLRKTANESRNIGPKNAKDAAYDHKMIRHKIFPMAAASYGDTENVKNCIRNTFRNATLYRNSVVQCNGKAYELCSAFTAVSHEDKAIILSFRGTDTGYQLIEETIQIALFKRSQSPDEEWGKVGSYFLKIFNQLVDEGKIIDDLAKLVNTYNDYEIWVTGHSLGGAMAAIASATIVDAKLISAQRLKLVTFGQPRTGNGEWATAMDKKVGPFNYRVVNNRDLVPHMPPLWFEGYRHHMTEVFYNNAKNKTEEFVICADEAESDECAGKYWFYNVRDHLNYFGKSVSEWGEKGCAN
ncbi:hypothetical protein niasHT_034064 [Heterodera trifolii]|uniref:Fungal lipase-type domain-containing protein n=1 Tax=Heterodera trifolii TaxID=157864 RepID=A0ABD2I3E2_9BILA